MNFDLGVRPGKNRHLVAMVALVAWALGAAACSGGGSGGGTGGKGAGGKATDAGIGTGGSGVGGAAGARPDAGPGDATDAPANDATDAPANDAPITDTGTLACIPDGGDASGDCCPDDPLKTQPGQCGCGVVDFDFDNDGLADCVDPCPLTLKAAPGICGCAVPDTDSDNDGTVDCLDGCPQNRNRVTPGLCGCALPDTAAPSCLAHRYSFDDGAPSDGGAGDAGTSDADAGDAGDAGGGGTTVVRDSVGTANGTAVNVVLRGTGTLTLTGGQTDQYVSLPSGIISALGNSATFEGWINWTGPGSWQRIFDFGVADPAMPGVQGTGSAFVFLTPISGPGVALFSVNTVGLTEVMSPGFFPQGAPGALPHHFAAVIDASAGDAGAPAARLYIDGTLVGSTPLTSVLSGLQDVNNWLGRSQFAPDPEFGGTYYEFRIHSAAMTQAQINDSIAAGPDRLP